MKLLHTADWHIGKKLHHYDLSADFDLFLSWLVKQIKDLEIDVLLVSGDVFDMANPSSAARKQYYNALIQLKATDCKIIITGGNHDSPNMLNAPKDILNLLDIHVIGGYTEDFTSSVVPIEIDNEITCIVAAIPYLRDADLRKANEGDTYEDRIKVVQKGIEKVYHNASDYCKTHFKDIPIIAMGHLYTAGASISDSERDIQMGNQALFQAVRFGEGFDYIALGHIHKPQHVNNATPTYYSGSPYPLSFSERKDDKRVLLIDTEVGFEPVSLSIPPNRRLIRISGDLDYIHHSLNNLEPPLQLTSLIEVHLDEPTFSAAKVQLLEETIQNFDKEGYEILHRTIAYNNKMEGTSDMYDVSQSLEELKPLDVFNKLLASQEMDEDTIKELTNAFQIVLEEVQQQIED